MHENDSHSKSCQQGDCISTRPRIHWRKLLFELHGWVGLNLGLILFVVCLSGTFATLSDEIDGLLDPRHNIATTPADDARFDWSAMWTTLEGAVPGGVAESLYAPGASGARGARGAAALGFVGLPTGETRKVYLDPYTGELLGHTSFFNVQRFFRTFHRRLFDGGRGILVVTLTGFALLLSAIAGFTFYRGWLEQALKVKLRGTRRRRWSDLHKVAGIWGLPFTALIAVTGIYYFVEVAYQSAGAYDELLSAPLPQVDRDGLASLGPQPELLPAGRYVELARDAYPALDVRSIRLPQNPSQAVYVDGQAGNRLTRDRADKLHLHPFTGAVLGVQQSGDLTLVPFLTEAVDPLHFGYFGGFATQLIWFALGLLLSFSILSGLYIWVVRSVSARKGPSRWLRGAPIAAVLTIGYLGVAAIGTVEGIRGYAFEQVEPVSLGEVAVGPYRVRMECTASCTSGERARLSARFLGEGLPSYERAEIVDADGESVRLSGPSRRPSARVRTRAGVPVVLRVTTRDAVVHEAALASFAASRVAVERPPWPDTAPGVWWVVVGFCVLTAGSIVLWLGLIWRVARSRARPA